MTELDRIKKQRAELNEVSGGLSSDELADLLEHAHDLKRNGTFRRRCHVAARHIVERFGGFDQEAPTAEYEPTRVLLNSLSPSSSPVPPPSAQGSDDAGTATPAADVAGTFSGGGL